MGLVFPLQPDLRHSQPEVLALQSTTKKFTVGGTFLLVGLVLATMYLAASPLFDLLWSQGAWFDRLIAGSFYGILAIYPFVTAACWFYKESVNIRRRADGLYDIDAWEALGPLRWARRELRGLRLGELEIYNWKGAVNVASIEATEKGQADRYATRGHWILGAQGKMLERRAKREDVDWLKAQVDVWFSAGQQT
jgi:hypothetical protein